MATLGKKSVAAKPQAVPARGAAQAVQASPQLRAAAGAGGGGLRHVDEAVASVLAREAYTRERHVFLVRMIVAQAAVILALVATVWFLATRPPQNHYFLTDNEGKIKEITSLDRPVNTLPEVTNWLSSAVTQAYTFSFANYQAELSAARVSFTPNGWKGFEKALKDSGNLKAVIENKYVSTAVPTGAAILISQGIVDGRYAYKFQLPILVTYQSAVQRTTQNLMVTVIVVRQPETEAPRGLGIAQLIAE
jgi:intracellular multiplication protein IcmL